MDETTVTSEAISGSTIQILAEPDASVPSLALGPVDPGSRYAFEHSGLGPSDFATDLVALLFATLVTALASSLGYSAAGQSGVAGFGFTFVHLVLCVPALGAALTSTRRRSLLCPNFSEQVQAIALPLLAGGFLVLGVWSGVSAAFGVAPPSLDWVLMLCVVGLTSVAGARVAHNRIRTSHRTRLHNVLIIGSGKVADQIADQMAQSAGIHVVGYVDDDPKDPRGCLGPLRALSHICQRESVNHLVVAFSRSRPQEIVDALRPFQGRLPITVVPRLFEVLPGTARVHELGSGLSGLSVPVASLGSWSRALKRALDIAVAGTLLVMLSPVLLLVGIAVRITSSGPALFYQARIGCKGRQFSMWKFRTMTAEHPHQNPTNFDGEMANGPFTKFKNDPRVTPFGRLLRRTSLDELPQLWNVLRGEMSLVGPRPFMLEDAALIGGWALRRYSVKPGITGLWQVSGRNELTFADMCRLDQFYVNCWSIGLDVRIIFRTVWVVLGGRGAY